MGALFVHLAVLYRQNDLGVLGHHAKEGGHPHPEHGAGATYEDGAGDAGNVTSTTVPARAVETAWKG